MNQDHVATIPMAETIEEVLKHLGACPFEYDPPEVWHSTVFVGASSLPASIEEPNIFFTAVGEKMDYWYDGHSGHTNLVFIFDSQDLKNVHNLIKSQAGVPSAYDKFVPHMTLKFGFPEMLTAANKHFVNSLSNSIRSITFKFQGLRLYDSHGYAPNREGMEYQARKT
jgi:2'-5' RNA ligase